MPVPDLKAWLEAMPPESEIESRISEVENELELLRAIKQIQTHALSSEAERTPPAPTRTEAPQAPSQNGALPPEVEALRSRLSEPRIRIIRAILDHRNSRATIPEVVNALGDPKDRPNVASNMQRMIKARLLSRVGRGRYGVTPNAAQLVRSLPDDDDPDVGRLTI